jgi:hypothetical protein
MAEDFLNFLGFSSKDAPFIVRKITQFPSAFSAIIVK